MAKINGTSMLVYADGTLIASQKNCTVSWEQDLPDASTKDSTGWEEHINGMRRCSCDFDALYSTTGLNSVGLMSYILNRSYVLLLIDGGGFPIVGQASLKNKSISAPQEDITSISGSFKFHGPAWMLTGAFANMLTDPDAGGTDYDTLTISSSGIGITSAINASGAAYCSSNALSVGNTYTYKVITFLTKTSGQLPTVGIYDNSSAFISNQVALVEGINIITLTATATDASASLRFTNSAAANFSLTNIYFFKV